MRWAKHVAHLENNEKCTEHVSPQSTAKRLLWGHKHYSFIKMILKEQDIRM